MSKHLRIVENIFIKESDGHELFAYDYCAQWGSTEGDKVLFYNISVEAETWNKEQWGRFVKAIEANIQTVKKNPKNFDVDEVECLEKLLDWAQLNEDESPN